MFTSCKSKQTCVRHHMARIAALAALTTVALVSALAQLGVRKERFRAQWRGAASAEEEEEACACRIHGKCPDAHYLRQGGATGCDLHSNYRACLKNARYGHATVVLNSGELVRRAIAGASKRQLRRRCRHRPSDAAAAGFACPDGAAPLNPANNAAYGTGIGSTELCAAR